jgi:hypothetical protein
MLLHVTAWHLWHELEERRLADARLPAHDRVLLCLARSASSVRSSARRSYGRPTNVRRSSRRPAASKPIGTTGSSMRATISIAPGSVTGRSAERVAGAEGSFMARHDRTRRDAPHPENPWVDTPVFGVVTGAESSPLGRG